MHSQNSQSIANSNAVWPDRLGTWASMLCVAHCLLTPVLLSMSAVFAHFMPTEERTHRTLAVLIAMIGMVALVRGLRRHRRLRVVVCMSGGLGCIFAAAWWGDRYASHAAEVAVTGLGSALMITAHRMNHTFCRQCACAAPLFAGRRRADTSRRASATLVDLRHHDCLPCRAGAFDSFRGFCEACRGSRSSRAGWAEAV
jgi:hypothetical protein